MKKLARFIQNHILVHKTAYKCTLHTVFDLKFANNFEIYK